MTVLADPLPGCPAGQPALVLVVHGTPAGQGQVTFLGKGRGARHTNAARLKPWRKAIIEAALAATGMHRYVDRDGACLACHTPKAEHPLHVGVPIAVSLTVTVPKPKTAPKRRRTWPITRYSTDIDHHARAALDSLSQAGIIADDSQVVELNARKVYPGEHPQALDTPGALIRIWPVTDTP